MSHSAVNITSMANACDFEFLRLGQSGVPRLQVCLFSCGFKMVTPHLIPCDNLQQKCITFSMEAVAMFQLY
jgi:hypothetical protein